MRGKRCEVFFLILPLVLITNALGQEPASLRRVRISMTSGGVDLFPLMVAHTYGFFRAEGLDAELILMSPAITFRPLAVSLRVRTRQKAGCARNKASTNSTTSIRRPSHMVAPIASP